MSLKSAIRTVITLGKGVMRGLPPMSDDRDPFELFDEWFAAAKETGFLLPESMTLATATPDGRPSARMVLLKGHGPEGFVFYTNYGSRKAVELDANPQASLCFHWSILERQVRIEGRTERISEEESASYFRTRTRGSRIGAWVSRQSDELPDAKEMQRRVTEYEDRFSGGEIPLPSFWGGYRLIPDRIEFWQGRANRLHDRLVFERAGEGEGEGEGGGWSTRRLYP